MVASRLLVHGGLTACAAVWGLVYVGIHQLLPVMSAVQLVTIRFVLISAAFLVLFAVIPALLAALLLDERLTPLHGLGSAIALAGVAFIVLFGAKGGGIGHVTLALPALLAVITPLSWSLYTVLSRPLAARYPPVATVGLCLTIGTVVLIPSPPTPPACFRRSLPASGAG